MSQAKRDAILAKVQARAKNKTAPVDYSRTIPERRDSDPNAWERERERRYFAYLENRF